jgi:hypothetical protein
MNAEVIFQDKKLSRIAKDKMLLLIKLSNEKNIKELYENIEFKEYFIVKPHHERLFDMLKDFNAENLKIRYVAWQLDINRVAVLTISPKAYIFTFQYYPNENDKFLLIGYKNASMKTSDKIPPFPEN